MPLLPLFPLEIVLFPNADLPLHIFEPRYREMIGECLEQQAPFGVVLQTSEGRADIGCAAEVTTVLERYDDGRLDILTQGRHRFRIRSTDQTRSFLRAEVDRLEEQPEREEHQIDAVIGLYDRTLAAHLTPKSPTELTECAQPSFEIARSQMFSVEQRQALLEMDREADRLDAVKAILEVVERTVKAVSGNGRLRRIGH